MDVCQQYALQQSMDDMPLIAPPSWFTDLSCPGVMVAVPLQVQPIVFIRQLFCLVR